MIGAIWLGDKPLKGNPEKEGKKRRERKTRKGRIT